MLKKNLIWLQLLVFFPHSSWADPFSGGLTDEEFKIKHEFVHEGHNKRIKEEACKDESAKYLEGTLLLSPEDKKKYDLCRGLSTPTLEHAVGDSLVEAIGKAYGMFALFTKFEYTDKKGNKQEKTDLCAMVPLTVEGIAQAQQSVAHSVMQATPVNPAEQQLESLHRAKKSHETRFETATIQSVGWGATTVCYIAMTAANAFDSSAMTGGQIAQYPIKIAAATLLASFYTVRAVRSKEAVDKMEALIKRLTDQIGKGKCNPISEVACYCAQPETKYDPQYCIPKVFAGRTDEPQTMISCTDNRMQSDPQCQCKASNTCYDTVLDQVGSEFDFGNAYLAKSINPIKSLTRGHFDMANSQAQTRNNLSAARNYLKNIQPELPPETILSSKQKEQIKGMQSLGLNPKLAAYMSTLPLNQKSKNFINKNNQEKMSIPSPEELSKQLALSQSKNSQSGALYFDQAGNRGRNAHSYDDGINADFLNKMKKAQAGLAKDDQILNFADRATRQAQIYQTTSKSIFEILSNRYKLSTWQKFQVIP